MRRASPASGPGFTFQPTYGWGSRSAEVLVTTTDFKPTLIMVTHDVEEAGNRRTGIAGQQVDAALGFEGAFDQQFVASEDFPAGFGQVARVGSHGQSFPRAAAWNARIQPSDRP